MRKSSPFLFSVVLVALVSSLATSAVPPRISYQGRVTDASGSPLPDGNQILKFSIYDVSIGGTALWTSGLREVPVSDGLFSYMLGDSSSLPLALFNAGTDFFLGIKVGGDLETTPRTRFAAVPYAYAAVTSDSADFATTIADNAVTSAKIQDGSIQLSDIGQNGANTGQIMKWDGGTWVVANDSSVSLPGAGGWIDGGTTVSLETPTDLVGIGTNTPSERVQIASGRLLMGNAGFAKSGNQTGDIILESNTTDLPGLKIYHAPNQNFGIDIFNHPVLGARLRFTEELDETGGQTHMLIVEGGNVGIGELVPSEKLDVAGVIRSSSGGFKFPDGSVQTSAASPGTGIVPIGSVVAWMKSLGGVPSLTQDSNFVECNGQTIIDIASPLNGVTIPDLNSQSRFLRGSLVSGGSGGSANTITSGS